MMRIIDEPVGRDVIIPTGRVRLAVIALTGAVRVGAVLAVSPEPPWSPPWEVWRDLASLAAVEPGGQVLLRSSHCPSGCRFDRHSQGDSRFIRVDGEEGVIFEASGPGAIVRIWMTMGQGTSVPLDETIRIRFYFDGETTPRIDLALPELFDGTQAPFLAPLVGDRLVSSGGNFSYVPIPYRDGCRVALVGADAARIWFQFGYHQLSADRPVDTFTGTEDLNPWESLLANPGQDPWPPDSGSTTKGLVMITPGQTQTLFAADSPGLISELRLVVEEGAWANTWLQLGFDGETAVDLSLADFFAVGRGSGTPTRSLLIGLSDEGELYSYFPMPYFRNAEFRVRNEAGAGSGPVAVAYAVRSNDAPPAAASGLFGASLSEADPTVPGSDFPLLSLDRPGKWVGLFAELGSVGTLRRGYLEGDERVFLDGAYHPGIYGTGTEDFFNGGFYFDQGPFGLALHGMSYHLVIDGKEDVTAAYRLMLTDAIPFGASIRAGLEGGPTSDVPLRARVVAYYYTGRGPELSVVDTLDLGDPDSILAHGYLADGAVQQALLDGFFEGEPPRALAAEGLYREAGVARFTMDASACMDRLRLRRRFDALLAGQATVVAVDGHEAGSLPYGDANETYRWRELDVDLPPAAVPGAFEIIGSPSEPGGGPFSEFQYQLLCRRDSVFANGFEP